MEMIYLFVTSCVPVFHYEPQEIKLQRLKICRYTYTMIVQYLNKLLKRRKRGGYQFLAYVIQLPRHGLRTLTPQRLK